MAGIEYFYAKLLKKLRGRVVQNCRIHPTSKVEAGSEVVNSNFDRHSYCGYYCQILNTDVGSYCSIANNVIIGSGDHPFDWVGTSPAFYKGRDSIKLKLSEHERSPAPRVEIGHDVWIGGNALIKGGVRLGTGSVVGMGSVVTRDVAPYEIVAGNPARPLKRRFDDQLVERLLHSKWWECDEVMLTKAAVHARSPVAFLEALGK